MPRPALTFCVSVTSAMRIRHSRPKRYCTLVLGRGRGQRRRLFGERQERVSTRYRITARRWSRKVARQLHLRVDSHGRLVPAPVGATGQAGATGRFADACLAANAWRPVPHGRPCRRTCARTQDLRLVRLVSNPDGNRWLLQELTSRLRGRPGASRGVGREVAPQSPPPRCRSADDRGGIREVAHPGPCRAQLGSTDSSAGRRRRGRADPLRSGIA
jgi:hypothetical protein